MLLLTFLFSLLILADNKTKAEAKTELPEPILKDKYLERFLEQFKVLFEGSLEESRRSILTPYVPEIFFQYTPNEVVSFSTSKANFKK